MAVRTWRCTMNDKWLDVTYDEESNTYRTTKPRTWDLSTAILIALEQIEETDVTEFPPLDSFVNVGALNKLFSDRHNGTVRRGGELNFYYNGYEVRAHHHGTILLSPQAESTEANRPSRTN